MAIGGYVGGYIPSLWGDSAISFASVILSAVGGLAGIWIGYQLSE